MSNHRPRLEDLLLTRREMLCRSGMGMGAMALAGLMSELGLTGAAEAAPAKGAPAGGFTNPLTVKQPHFPAKAKRVIHLFMNGGPSHVDTFDPKPKLDKYHGQALPRSS